MLIVTPISAADAELADSFASAVRHFGPNPEFDCLVVARPRDLQLAEHLQKQLDGLFRSVSIYIFAADGPDGWPKGPNFYWAQTALHISQDLKSAAPWFWMELDCTPLKEGWAMDLLTAYNIGQKPFLGAVEPTMALKNGEVVTNGEHLVGAAIYPPDMASRSLLLRYTPTTDVPFDVYCQWEIAPHATASKLIQHAFRTKNYKRTPEGIKGEDHNDLPGGVRFDRVLDPAAVVHHGCDDGSLAALLIGAKSSIVEEKSPEPEKVSPKTPEPEKVIPTDTRRRVAAIREQGVMA